MERFGISQTGAVSRTAMMTACGRGSHLLEHGPQAVLEDWLAWPLVGTEAESMTARMRAAFGRFASLLSTWISARSRFTEDWLMESGSRQYVVLGAGLDSFAWRQRSAVRVFEVDHPVTQEWKRSRLEALGVPVPPELVWVPVDFEVESIGAGLARAGLGSESIFVSWLGVVPYLSLDAIASTLGQLPPCLLAVSYTTPEELWPPSVREVSQTFRTMAVQAGEPPRSRFTEDQFRVLLADRRFDVVEHVDSGDVERRYGLPALSVGHERIALARSTAGLTPS